ncbi:MAG: hypothetical protein ACKO83_06870 [Roseiflexaceae bacterium]
MYSRARRFIFMIVMIGGVLAGGYWWYETARTVELTITDPQQALPTQITLIRGIRDVLVIKNASTSTVTVAGTTLAPGQQFRQYYRSAGDYSFNCSVHNGQTLHVVVRDP